MLTWAKIRPYLIKNRERQKLYPIQRYIPIVDIWEYPPPPPADKDPRDDRYVLPRLPCHCSLANMITK